MIYGWVEKNTSSSDIEAHLERAFSYINDSEIDKEIKNWILNHKDKLRYISDFSGLEFGINFYEETENIQLRFPVRINFEDKPLYPDYDEKIFMNMKIIDKLNWMYNHCEFIPFRIIYEDIEVNSCCSYKFSHIKRNSYIMNLLNDYLKNAKYQPNDDVYYFVCFHRKYHDYYLRRDLEMSPKHK